MHNRTSVGSAARRALITPTVVLVLTGVVAGCGNVTAGGIGQANLYVTGDIPEVVAPSVSGPSPAFPAPGAPSRAEGDQPEGEVEVDFLPFLIAEDSTLVQLTDDEVRVRVDLEGAREWDVASRAVTARRYVGLRLVFLQIEAEVDAGLVINGQPVTGPIDVKIEGTLSVDKSLDLPLGDAQAVDLILDLNSADWLQAVDPATATVSPEVFAELIEVVVRDSN